MMEEPQDREITLSVGRMFALFLGLVFLCGLFMALGYTLGRSSQRAEGSIIGDAGGPAGGGSKPAPSQPQPRPPEPQTQGTPSGLSPQDMTFYKAVQQPTPNTHLPATASPAPAQNPPAAAPQGTLPVAAPGYRMQVAAVSRQEDATVLRDALERKGYPAMIATSPGDSLFHIQVGPYADLKEAEQVRSRLVADGYNPILKR